MSSSLPQKNLSKKQKGKRKVSPSSPTTPSIQKRARTKVQERKDSFDATVHEMLKSSKVQQSSIQDSSLISKNFFDLVPDDKLQRYVNEFLNKPIESEYYVNKLIETELDVKF